MNEEQLKLKDIYKSLNDKLIQRVNSYYVHRSTFVELIEKLNNEGMYIEGIEGFIINDEGVMPIGFIFDTDYDEDSTEQEIANKCFNDCKKWFENTVIKQNNSPDLYLGIEVNAELPLEIEFIESARQKKSME
jgi:hypothetical protein